MDEKLAISVIYMRNSVEPFRSKKLIQLAMHMKKKLF